MKKSDLASELKHLVATDPSIPLMQKLSNITEKYYPTGFLAGELRTNGNSTLIKMSDYDLCKMLRKERKSRKNGGVVER